MLALEIEFLTGNVVAANSEKSAVDWPPQPDRVFSALVATWAARGERADERAALEWLERQNAPRILAGEVAKRTIPTVYVPPNDLKTSATSLAVLPSRRLGQARSFAAGNLENPLVTLVWPQAPPPEITSALDALARDTAYIGHSSSLTRCRFVEKDVDLAESRAPKRSVYEGRLAELERLFKRGERPTPGDVVITAPAAQDSPPCTVFSSEWQTHWVVFADEGGPVPDIRAVPMVARKLRDALMGAYQRAFQSAPPSWLSGHADDGTPLASPHAAFIPMADLGWDYAQGRMMGLAIVLPRGGNTRELYGSIQQLCAQNERRTGSVELHYGGAAPWILRPQGIETSRASLAPARWVQGSRLWATATPIVLDRHPKKRNPEERAKELHDLIARACENIGLPSPTYTSCSAVSAIRGGPPAQVGSHAPQWQRWRMPDSLQNRYLTHAIVGFDHHVTGPLILGAGRYVGLGLCLPFAEENTR